MRTTVNIIFSKIFERVLRDGGWDGAVAAATSRSPSSKPWVVLVTGLNGIRKTTSVNSPWFRAVLHQALSTSYDGTEAELPDGANSFFRQLDFMVATLALDEFRALYETEEVDVYAKRKVLVW